MNILITGGNGFIGSHTYVALRERFPDAQLVIVDNLSNSTTQTIERLGEYHFDAIIHNPVGAHESGLIGGVPNGILNNLIPYITKVAKGEYQELDVFGGDYPTFDGTGVRDYIHVMDLAEGHVAALEHLVPGAYVYNLGTGKGTSVLQLIQTFEKVNGIAVPYQIVDRRPGDLATVYADVSKAQRELNWEAKRTMKICA